MGTSSLAMHRPPLARQWRGCWRLAVGSKSGGCTRVCLTRRVRGESCSAEKVALRDGSWVKSGSRKEARRLTESSDLDPTASCRLQVTAAFCLDDAVLMQRTGVCEPPSLTPHRRLDARQPLRLRHSKQKENEQTKPVNSNSSPPGCNLHPGSGRLVLPNNVRSASAEGSRLQQMRSQ